MNTNFPGKKYLAAIYKKSLTFYGIFKLKQYLKNHKTINVIIGSENTKLINWISTEQSFLDLTNKNHWEKYFKHNSISAIFAEHVWEHLTPEDAKTALENCYYYLKPKGCIRIAIPDGFHPNQNYIDLVKVNGTGLGAHDHKVLYNYKSISEILTTIGYQVELLEYFDETGQFHFKNWNDDRGHVYRSSRYDKRNSNGQLNYTSLIIDGIKTK